MVMIENARRALRPDAQAFDEVRIKTVPRYKESELSGDEWRISANVEFLRKGEVIHTENFSDIERACGFAYAEYQKVIDSAKGYFVGIGDFCDQEGCSSKATVTLKLKKVFCSHGLESDLTTPQFRMFCEKHSTRGDCGLDDADANYTTVSP